MYRHGIISFSILFSLLYSHVEDAQLYQRSLGEASDVVMKEMYTFRDLGGNKVAMRPEGTAGIHPK